MASSTDMPSSTDMSSSTNMSSSTDVLVKQRPRRFSDRGLITYFPVIPPKPPKEARRYVKAMKDAPHTALTGLVSEKPQPDRYPVKPRHRLRRHVGISNRWRLPEALGFDLLGSAQAGRSCSITLNSSMLQIISGENARLSLNTDMGKPYQFKAINAERPNTTACDTRPLVSKLSKPTKNDPVCASSSAKRGGSCPVRRGKPEMFQYHSKGITLLTGPDVLLKCLGINWELHRPLLQKSGTLSELLKDAESPISAKSYYKNKVSETLDDFIMKSSFYSADYKEMASHLKTVDKVVKAEVVDEGRSGIAHPKHTSVQKINNMTVISLDNVDDFMTQRTLAIALGNLYREADDIQVTPNDVVGCLAAAHALKFNLLEQGCAVLMMKTINYETICSYHKAAVKFNRERMQEMCERWLELNLVPQMSSRIEMRKLSHEVLQKTLQANRLFTTNEFQLFKIVAFWTYLQINPEVQIMPSYTSVIAFFNCLPKSNSLIEREEGQRFAPLFMSLRLHGITDTNHFNDIQAMNVLPQSWIIKVLSQHYHSLQGGGDMAMLSNFYTDAIRYGFIIQEEPHYQSDIFSLHGFHFEFRGIRQSSAGVYHFYIQRLKPTDPVLSFKECERSTFSMRADRDVKYCIRIQHVDANNRNQMYSTGIEFHRFGMGTKTSKSKVIALDKLVPPIYVSFAVVFPPS